MKRRTEHLTPRERFEAYLRGNHLRYTQERFAILECVLGSKGHFLVKEIHEDLDKEGYHTSLQTVYSTVSLLCDAGIVRRHRFEGSQAVYEVVARSHSHLVCTSCGKVREFNASEVDEKILSRRFRSFSAQWCAVTVYGLCSDCRKTQKKK